MNFPLQEALIECQRRRDCTPDKLIEAMDGFHPSHEGHKLFADFIWQHLETKLPSWIGPVNPHNGDIRKYFKQTKFYYGFFNF
jgi:hypothetical protein